VCVYMCICTRIRKICSYDTRMQSSLKSDLHCSSSLWHHLRFLCWKSPTDWNKVGGDWRRVSCHGNRIFIVVGVFPLELLSYHRSVMQIGQDNSINILHIILGWVYDIMSHFICIFHIFFTHKYLRNYCNADISKC